MTETTTREINCVLCEETYAPVLGPEEGEKSYRIYCSSCVNWVAVGRTNPLRLSLRIALGLKGKHFHWPYKLVFLRVVVVLSLVVMQGVVVKRVLKK